jgi:hypothetical protein
MIPGGGDPHGPPGDDTGQPIRLLLDQELVPSSRFMARVRGKIYRRAATSHLASYSWHLPKLIFVEIINVLGQLFSGHGRGKDS